MSRNNAPLIPEARRALEKLKYEVAEEIGFISPLDAENGNYNAFLDQYKYEVANELGIQLNHGYNGDITAKNAGRIGGKMGGKIGGNMVRKMIEFAEKNMQQ